MSLIVEDLSVEIGGTRVVDGVSFEVPDGARTGIIGESGSGKSLTALAIMGLLPDGAVASGSIRWDGRELIGMPDRERARIRGREIGMIFQEPASALNPIRRVGVQMSEAARIHRSVNRRDAAALAVDLARDVGLPSPETVVDSYPHQLSGGQRQRVGIAAALAGRPSLVVADEPTTALDVTVQAQIMALLGEIQEHDGTALLLITHDLGVVADVADRAVVMYGGRVAESGSIREVYDHPAHPYTVGLMGSIPGLEGDRKRLNPIVGSPPDPRHMPSGCAFHPRCPMAVEVCAETRPDLRLVSGRPTEQLSACHRAEEV